MGDWRWRGDKVSLEVVLIPGRDGKFKDTLKRKAVKGLEDFFLSHIGSADLLGND